MTNALKPTFTKPASYAGPQASYDAAVWELATTFKAICGNTEPDGDMFRMNTTGVSNGHVTEALQYLQRTP